MKTVFANAQNARRDWLVVDAAGILGQHDIFDLRHDTARRFHEDHTLPIWGVPEVGEFGDVIGVVLADAEDAIDVHGLCPCSLWRDTPAVMTKRMASSKLISTGVR